MHSHETRQKNYIHIAGTRTTSAKQCIRQYIPTFLTSIPTLVSDKIIVMLVSQDMQSNISFNFITAISGELCAIGQLVLRGSRIVMPRKLRPQALALAHEGHLGIVGTKQALRSKVWWPGIDKAVETYCRSSHGCQLVARPAAPEPIRSTTLPVGPWIDVGVDLLGPLPSGHSILVVVDYYSRYYKYSILQSTTTEKVLDSLDDMFSRQGWPMTIKSDNGPQFRSDEFGDYCTHYAIQHLRVTAKWRRRKTECVNHETCAHSPGSRPELEERTADVCGKVPWSTA